MKGMWKMPKKEAVAEKGEGLRERLVISAPNMQTAEFAIVGTSPLVFEAFSRRVLVGIANDRMKGKAAKTGKKEPPDYDRAYEESMHRTRDGKLGMPATWFRCAMIGACRMVDFKMTRAKMALFVEPDGFEEDGTPLILVTKGKPHKVMHRTRNATGVMDIRSRAMLDEGWEAKLRVTFDGDQFHTEDVANLLMRAGRQNGIGAGRANSKMSAGMGWGSFDLKQH
jgi:hypothetical protein